MGWQRCSGHPIDMTVPLLIPKEVGIRYFDQVGLKDYVGQRVLIWIFGARVGLATKSNNLSNFGMDMLNFDNACNYNYSWFVFV